MAEQWLSQNYFVGTGTRTTWEYSFAGARPDNPNGGPYLSTDDVRVALVDRDEVGVETRTPVNFTHLGTNQVIISPAIAVGQEFVIYRETELSSPLVDYTDFTAVTERDLDTSYRQNLYTNQELRDYSRGSRALAEEARRDTAAALDVISEIVGSEDPLVELVRRGELTDAEIFSTLARVSTESGIQTVKAALNSRVSKGTVGEESVTTSTGTQALAEALDGRVTKGEVGGEEVSTATGEQTLAEALDGRATVEQMNRRVIYVATIADLQALDTSGLVDGQQVQVKEYSAGTGVGGGKLYWDAGSTEVGDGGAVFEVSGVATGRWKRAAPARTPEDWGAVGDGSTDDTVSVKAWWESGVGHLVARGDYLIYGTDSLLRIVDSVDFYADLRGATFNISEARAYFLRVDIVTDSRNVWVQGGEVVGNNNVAKGIEIRTESVSAGTVAVKDFIISGVFANDGLGYTSSATGIAISCECSQILVNGCRVVGVDRAYVNPGVVASVGISVTEVIASASITDNVVVDVWSPAGDGDADGISVFSRDRLLVGRQQVKIEIAGNRLRDCKGRFIKLQTTEAHVWGNRFDSTGGDLVVGFRAIDCQFGGCNIHDNFWNLLGTVTGMQEGVFVLTQFKDTGNWESRTVVAGNFVVLERELRYLVSATLRGGASQIEVLNNYVKANQSPDFLSNNIVRVDTPDIGPVVSARVLVRDNTYPGNRDSIVQLVGEDFANNPAVANKISFIVTGNQNTRTPAAIDSNIISVALIGNTVPHLQNVVIQGNNNGDLHRINAKSMSVDNLPNGSSFYYGTDGGSGGLIGAPAGYTSYVHVQTVGGLTRLTRADGRRAERISGGGWYESTGTAL